MLHSAHRAHYEHILVLIVWNMPKIFTLILITAFSVYKKVPYTSIRRQVNTQRDLWILLHPYNWGKVIDAFLYTQSSSLNTSEKMSFKTWQKTLHTHSSRGFSFALPLYRSIATSTATIAPPAVSKHKHEWDTWQGWLLYMHKRGTHFTNSHYRRVGMPRFFFFFFLAVLRSILITDIVVGL